MNDTGCSRFARTRPWSLDRAARSLGLLVLSGALFSCAGQNPPAESPPAAEPPAAESAAPAAPAAPAPEATAAPAASESASAEAAPAPSGPIDWEKMDKKARGKYMKEVVLPKMKEIFVAFDAAKYADMNCKTCHGSAAESGEFTMPNPELPKLPGTPAKFKAWAQKRAKMSEFMMKQVKPEMAKLLNMPEFDPATKQGFGCGACHAIEK